MTSFNQISVFLDNRQGRLADLTVALAKDDISIRSMNIADTTDFGILRMIVDKPQMAVKVLKAEGFTVRTTSVIGVFLEDKPGGLYTLVKLLSDAEISIEYAYAFVTDVSKNQALVAIKADDPVKASEIIEKAGMKMADESYFSK